jgi:hypothetical protein
MRDLQNVRFFLQSMVVQGYFKDSNSPFLVLLVYLIWVVLSSVLLLNLLIAMMGKTFQIDDEDTDRIWTFPFAALVLKYEKLLTDDQVDACDQMHEWFIRINSKWTHSFLRSSLVCFQGA